MIYNIRGDKLKITDAIHNYVEEKLGKLNKYFDNENEITANVLLKVRGNEQIVEVTIPVKKVILRSEESNKDLYAAIDLVVDKLERQISKKKTRMHKKVNKEVIQGFNIDFESDIEEEEGIIAKRKTIEMKPMNEEEAILQMTMIGHEFFVFKNEEGNISVLYKRKDGNFGIIETK